MEATGGVFRTGKWSLERVPPDDLPGIWMEIAPRLQSAVDTSRGKLELGDFAALIGADRMQLWLVRNGNKIAGVVVTEVADFPRQVVCRIVACVGVGLHDWIGFIEEIEDWARTVGCGAMQLIARKGYARALRQFDYEQTHVLLEKELADG